MNEWHKINYLDTVVMVVAHGKKYVKKSDCHLIIIKEALHTWLYTLMWHDDDNSCAPRQHYNIRHD